MRRPNWAHADGIALSASYAFRICYHIWTNFEHGPTTDVEAPYGVRSGSIDTGTVDVDPGAVDINTNNCGRPN